MEKDGYSFKDKIEKLFSEKNNKIRNFIVILLVGICLFIIVWPADSGQSVLFQESDTEKEQDTESSEMPSVSSGDVTRDEGEMYIETMEARLEDILSGVKNVGEVHVMITRKDSGETIALKDQQTDYRTDEQGEQKSESQTTVFTDYEGNSEPYISKILEPEIEGILIACEGGGNPATVMEITEAVQALFNVPVHKIVVLELK